MLLYKRISERTSHNEIYLKINIKSYEGKINTSFQDNRIAKEGSHCIYLSVILIGFVFETDKNYYPQVFLEEFKYVK